MKPLTSLLMAPSVGASPSSEEFVIEAIQEAAPVRPLPAPPPKPMATDSAIPSKLIEVVQGAASWYGPGFYGRTTANGERFDRAR